MNNPPPTNFKDPTTGITVVMDRHNGKGFTSVRITGGRFEELATFLVDYLRIQRHEANPGKVYFQHESITVYDVTDVVDGIRYVAGRVVQASGKNKVLERQISKALVAWFALEKYKADFPGLAAYREKVAYTNAEIDAIEAEIRAGMVCTSNGDES